MTEEYTLAAHEELRFQLLAAVKAMKSRLNGYDKFTLGLDGTRRARVRKDAQQVPQSTAEELQKIKETMAECLLCRLGKTRRNLVFGDGNPQARIVFVGEAPGADEDEQGLPFVGRAGQLLTKIIEAMGMKRGEVYICNILKCRPPQNRNPLPEEIAACEPFLKRQLKSISPQIICALGTFAAKTLLRTEVPISVLRGRFHLYEGIKLMPTYHPAYLLRNPSAKKLVWEDVQLIMKELQN